MPDQNQSCRHPLASNFGALSAIILAALMIAPHLIWAQAAEKPVAALGRVATLGNISEGQKRIIITRLESKLSQVYQLVSQEQYQRAEEAAFAELDLEKCTAEECIRKIQEILQVERLFILQIIAEPELTQLSLNLVRTDSKQVVDSICENCSLIKMYKQVDKLADNLITADIRASAKELSASLPAVAKLERPRPARVAGTPRRLAIFPASFDGEWAHVGADMHNGVVDEISRLIAERFPDQVQITHILNPTAPNNTKEQQQKAEYIKDNAWVGFFSKEPNKKFIIDTAQKLDVDFIFLYRDDNQGGGHWFFDLYLLNMESKELHHKSDSAEIGPSTFGRGLNIAIGKSMVKFLEEKLRAYP